MTAKTMLDLKKLMRTRIMNKMVIILSQRIKGRELGDLIGGAKQEGYTPGTITKGIEAPKMYGKLCS